MIKRRPRRRRPGGCGFFVDPAIDARAAHPHWSPEPVAIPQLTRDDSRQSEAPRFKLWSFPGRKTLSIADADARLSLTIAAGHRVHRVGIAEALSDGDPIAFVMPADRHLEARSRAPQGLVAMLHDGCDSANIAAPRPDRTAVLNMRSVQALDGAMAGASEREIGIVIYGRPRVEENWTGDGGLRSHVRYLLKRAHACMNGGYRKLVQSEQPVARRSSARKPIADAGLNRHAAD